MDENIGKCVKCGKEITGCICFTGEGDMCNRCFGKYFVKEIMVERKTKQPIKMETPMSKELREKI